MGEDKRKLSLLIVALLGALTIIVLLFIGFFPGERMGGTTAAATMQLNEAKLYGGPVPVVPTCSTGNSANLSLSLYNPHSSLRNMTQFILTGANTTIHAYYLKNGVCSQITPTSEPGIAANANTTLTLYFGGAIPSTISTGSTFDYVIDFASGESISGSLAAQ